MSISANAVFGSNFLHLKKEKIQFEVLTFSYRKKYIYCHTVPIKITPLIDFKSRLTNILPYEGTSFEPNY